jgi:pSer/pThr/pTyr-binding forkhead associated (FHA) protein
LVHVTPVPTLTISELERAEKTDKTKPTPAEGPDLRSGAIFGLRVVDSGDVVSLVGRTNYTIGRSNKGQAVIPDVDLAMYEAYDHGVSRLHAEMRIQPDRIFVIDLDSANGTIVNGERLKSLEEKVVHHGDIIQLGRMRLQIISRQRS